MSWHRIFLAVLIGFVSVFSALADSDEPDREGGIIGTGILGTVTDLGSIYVNGQHILFAPDFPVTEGVSASKATQLRPGHTVAVVAVPENDHWRASYIRQVVPLLGPVQEKSDGRLVVMGSTVIADAAAIQGIRTGDWVAVSGLWQSGRVVATRIDRVDAAQGARIEGTAIGFTPGEALVIGGTRIAGLLPRHIQEGDVLRAFGTAEGSALRAERLETGVFAGRPQITFSEGYFSVPTASGLYTLLGAEIVSYTDNPAMIDPSARHLVCSNDGKLFPAAADQLPQGGIKAILTECASGGGG